MKFVKIDKVHEVESNQDVYDIQLEKNHYFKANDIYTHNCRLKNDISVSTGSINVITINMNRLVQDAVKNNIDIFDYLTEQVSLIHKYQISYRHIVQDYKDAGMLPVYDAGFISLDKQFLTIGVNGLTEAAEFLGLQITPNKEYMDFAGKIFKTISDSNKEISKLTGFKFNTELVPAENLGVKNASWDRKDEYVVNRDCYNSYMYLVEDSELSVPEKFRMHGKEIMQYIDGGSAYHCNLEEYPSKEGFKKLLDIAASEGCEYFCFNIKITICNECNAIDKRTLYKCPKCGSINIDHGTRVIGYLKRVSAFSEARQKEHSLRFYNAA